MAKAGPQIIKNIQKEKLIFPLPAKAELSLEEGKKAYKIMLLIRRFEEKVAQLYTMGAIGGFCHLYIGQEAVITGNVLAAGSADQFITSYREHGHVLALGVAPERVMAELAGRSGGLCKGRGGSMHLFSKEKNFYGGHGIVGASVPLGTGLAFANHYRNEPRVCFTYFGDGAANQGQVYESFNMASLWKLPVVYIVENNKYAMGTAVERATAEPDFSRHGWAFSIPGAVVDGMDVAAVKTACAAAREFVTSGNGPVLLDIHTYRYRGHSMSDPGKYREREEVQQIRLQRDPIEQLAKKLAVLGVGQEELKAIDLEVKAIVAEAASYAQNNAEPDQASFYEYIYR